MSDLINRQELLDRVNYLINQVKYCKVGTLTFKDGLMDGYCEIRSIVKEFPSAQPEIIHCRDCAKSESDSLFQDIWCDGKKVTAEHYCGYAERREDG